MDSFQLNKIAGAVLGTLTVLLGVNAISEGLFHHKKPEKPGFEVAEGKKEGEGGGAPQGVEALLASADPAKGEQAAKKCGACHSFGKGEPAKLGPNLFGVVGLPHAHQEGFAYSDAMKKTHDKKWDFANLDKWLEDPKAYIAGNKMSFAGVKDPAERANIIAYLNKNSEKPLELPKAGAKPAAGGGGGDAGGGVEAKVAAADPAKGEQVSKKCAACHSFKKGEPAKVGPNLYGIVGNKHAHQEGFAYSDAMKKTGGQWDVASLDKWIEDPKAAIPGNKMAFAGVKDAGERANLIAYLNKNSDKPVELKAAAAGGGDKKAEGGAPAGGDAGGGFAQKVAAADPAKGESVSKRCAACHSFKKGEPAKVGPNLYGIVGLPHAHMEGFGYSDAMKKTHDKVWDVENLGKWLEDPKAYIPGNKMAFAGVKNEDERASLVAYLNKNSDKPADLKGGAGGGDKPEGDKKTEAAPAPAGGEQKPAEGEKKADAPAPAAPAGEEKKAEAPAAAPAPAAGGEQKPQDQAAKPEEGKPAEAKPDEKKPEGEQQAAAKPEEAKPAEDKPAEGGDKAAAPAAGGGEVAKLLASADAGNGEKVVQEQCAACHTFNKGGEAGAGPNLYGIVGAKHAHQEGFEYSDAFKGHQQGPWDFALLDQWLTDPAKVVPGTMMAFPGIQDAKQRADVIAYLNKNSDKPVDLPK